MVEILPVEQLWQQLRREAADAVARDPVFGAAVQQAVLDHPDFASALARLIGARLGSGLAEQRRFAQLASEAFAASPGLIEAASRDLQGILVHDPAAKALLPSLLNYKGYVALEVFRVSAWLWHQDRRDLAVLLQSLSSDQLAVSIHPSATIGTSVFLDHGTGIVIGAFSEIGDGVAILQNTTIGRKPQSPELAPRIGKDVFLSAGSTILGGITIGDGAKIGADAVVEDDVPPGCTAVGVPARLTNCPEPALLA